MPQTGYADPSATTPSKSMQRVKNKNNIIGMFMRKKVEIFEREKDINISNIDQDRLDIHDFLKQLKKCESDNLPEAKHWLGDRTPRRPSQVFITGKDKSAAAIAAANHERELEEQRQHEKEREEYEKYNYMFRTQEDQPEMVRRATRLYNLYSKRAIYAGMNQQAWDDWNKQEETQRRENEENRSMGPSSGYRDNISTPMKLDTVASVTTGEEGAVVTAPAAKRSASPGRAPLRATFTADAIQRSHTMPVTDHPQFSRSAHPQLQRGKTDGGDFMKELLVRKYRRRKKKKEPIEDRLQSFYEKVADLKVEETARATELAAWENARRWTMITKGVKAALAESSDEEDENPDHTV